MVLKKGQPTARLFKVPLEMAKTPAKSLSNECVSLLTEMLKNMALDLLREPPCEYKYLKKLMV